MTVNLSALGGAGQQFFDNNGNVLTGGKLWSYQAGTTTPQTTYTSASGVTAHTNPIVLDSAGRVATGEIWLTLGNNYKFVLMTSASVTIATWDNITGVGTSNAETITYDPPFIGGVVTTVQEKLEQCVSVKDFGAVGDGVTSDVVAVNNAITWANSASGSVTINFPNGSYNLKAGVTAKITKGDVSIVGENAKIEAETGKIFDFDGSGLMYRNTVKGIFFNYPSVTVDVNATPLSFTQCLYFEASQIRVFYAPAVIYMESCSNGVIDDIFGLTANVARNAIHVNSCSVLNFDNIGLINDAGLQPINPATPYPNPPVSGNCFIRVTGQTVDTLYFKAGVLCNRYRRGFHATCGLTQALLNVWVESCVFDYCYDKGVFIENLGSSVSGITMSDLYIQAMQGNGLHIKTDGGLTNKINITRPFIGLSGVHSLLIESVDPTSCTNVVIRDPYIYGGNRLNSSGIDVLITKARAQLLGGAVGLSALPYTGLALQANFGVFFDGCDQYTVTGVTSGGVVGSYEFANNPSTNYRARSVYDNSTVVGFSASTKPEYETTTLSAVVSGTVYTNASPYKQYVSVYGAAASGAADINVNGQQYSTRSEWSGILNQGDNVTITTGHACNIRRAFLP